MTGYQERNLIISLVIEAEESGARKKEISKLMNIPIRTLQRWQKNKQDRRQTLKRPAPLNKLTDKERDMVKEVCTKKEFVDKTPKVIVPELADQGVYIASESTMYRILREEKMIAHRSETRIPTQRRKPPELVATGPNQVWSWDITYLKTSVKGIFFYLYLFLDVWSRKIVGWKVYESQKMEYAKEVFIEIEQREDVSGVHLHSDNGAPMKGATFLATLQKLGVVPSFSRPSCSNDNAYSESLFKTLKYTPSFPAVMQSIEHATSWSEHFVNWYNCEHKHSEIKYVTPEQRHSGHDIQILKQRKEVYLKAKQNNPARWSNGQIRNWNWNEVEILNQEEKKEVKSA